MQTLKSFLNQAMMIWTESTGAGRIGIALLLVICVGGIVGVGVWSSQPNYVPLASGLQSNEAADVIDALAAADIVHKFKGTSTILVDKPDLPRAKIATAKLGLNYSEQSLEQSSPWMDPGSQRDLFRRNKEKQLENSIAKFKSVKSSEVHLSIPKRETFLRESDQPSAAVIIEASSNSKFGDSDAAAIASLVANSESGLMLENVSITDTQGNVYSSDNSIGNMSWQEEFRIEREHEFTRKAERLLSRFLGHGNTSVAVTTSYSFDFGTTKSRTYDPENKVLQKENVGNTTTKGGRTNPTGGRPPAVGSAGTAENIGTRSSNPTSAGTVVEDEQIDNEYLVPETERFSTDQTPVRKMMTVSVVVNKSTVEDENKVVPASVKDQLTSLVSNAVGLDDSTDQIAVEFMDFVDLLPVEEVPVTAIPWDQINQVLKNVSLGFAALVALFVALKVLKSFQPGQVVTSSVEPVSQANQLSELVNENPEVFSKIIATWSSLESKPDNDLNSKAA